MMAAEGEGSPHFYDDHPSLSASLEDFEHNERSPVLDLPSQHSGFKSESSESDEEAVSEGIWEPPAWRQHNSPGGWYRHQPYPRENTSLKHSTSASCSRGTSQRYESAREDEDLTLAANIPLPRGSLSPVKGRTASHSPSPDKDEEFDKKFVEAEEPVAMPERHNNYIRFALRAEVQQRTEPIEEALSWVRTYWAYATKSRSSLTSTLTTIALAWTFLRLLTHTPSQPPVPDLVKVAGLARSFEPLIFYSENGARQIGELQDTGVAVWDLGESVRYANMTSAPMIVDELDGLSESLKILGIELQRFFANVDGDIDGILIIMDWAKRELSALSAYSPSSFSSAFTNIHTVLSHVGMLQNSSTGQPTALARVFTMIFGTTHAQRTSQTLHRTFNEFLNILEESIDAELQHATTLFTLFEKIDRQFLNLQRMVIRETDTQERLETEFLSSLWTRLVGPNNQLLRKYEKNKQLLASVRLKTTQNKSLLMEHNGKLISLKGNLESLRRKLVSPLVRRGDSSTIAVEEQVRGLEGTYKHLNQVRQKQKGRMLEALYGAGSRRSILGKEEPVGIDA